MRQAYKYKQQTQKGCFHKQTAAGVQKLPSAGYFFEPELNKRLALCSLHWLKTVPFSKFRMRLPRGYLQPSMPEHQHIDTKLATMIGPTATKVYPTAKPSLQRATACLKTKDL